MDWIWFWNMVKNTVHTHHYRHYHKYVYSFLLLLYLFNVAERHVERLTSRLNWIRFFFCCWQLSRTTTYARVSVYVCECMDLRRIESENLASFSFFFSINYVEMSQFLGNHSIKRHEKQKGKKRVCLCVGAYIRMLDIFQVIFLFPIRHSRWIFRDTIKAHFKRILKIFRLFPFDCVSLFYLFACFSVRCRSEQIICACVCVRTCVCISFSTTN